MRKRANVNATSYAIDDGRNEKNPNHDDATTDGDYSVTWLIGLFSLFLSIGYLIGANAANLQVNWRFQYDDVTSNFAPLALEDINTGSEVSSIPPLEDILDKDGNVIGDISWMLDFAVIGYPKTGTTYLLGYLDEPEDTYLHPSELCFRGHKKHRNLQKFVKEYHALHLKFNNPNDGRVRGNHKKVKFGLKCPSVLFNDGIQTFQKHFPKTKLIVGMRHPVSWFESYYNYRVRRHDIDGIPPPTSELITGCFKSGKLFCAEGGRFHVGLSKLKGAPMEFKWNGNLFKYRGNLPNEVFIYDKEQMDSDIFRLDLENYLGIDLPKNEGHSNVHNGTQAINICDTEHDMLRERLVKYGNQAVDWITNEFVDSSGVVVSTSGSFVQIIQQWKNDPCLESPSQVSAGLRHLA